MWKDERRGKRWHTSRPTAKCFAAVSRRSVVIHCRLAQDIWARSKETGVTIRPYKPSDRGLRKRARSTITAVGGVKLAKPP
jgi:hypothetical protein